MKPNQAPIRIIAAACGRGSPDSRCAAGPEALLSAGLLEHLSRSRRKIAWKATLDCAIPALSPLEAVAELCPRLAEETAAAVGEGALPLILTGDHSCAVGTWAGISHALRPRGDLGLLWIDAHLDSHTPDTSHTGAIHGMPLAALLGFGDPVLTECGGGGAKIKAEHLCIVGARSYEAEEVHFLAGLGVRIFYMDEIERRGIAAVLDDALQIVQSGTTGFGISIDLDAIDPVEAPGVGTPAAYGLGADELCATLRGIGNHPALAGIELSEYNPARDRDGRTARVGIDLLGEIFEAASDAALPAIETERLYGAHNYDPLPVVLVRGQGCHLWDQEGRKYLDMMSAYSAVSHGHANPRLLRVLTYQAGTLAVTSRAYYNERLPRLLRRLCEITGLDMALPVNTGLEAVETALKTVRKWAYRVKGVKPDGAEIIVCRSNFHGRSIAIVGMSTEPQYRDSFGPFPPGYRFIPYADTQALEDAITPQTAAFIVEPIQGEGGIIVPPEGYLAECARICRQNNVLLIADEVQTGFGRTGKLFACEHDNVRPDGIILGKALGGGLLPVSAFVARREVLGVLKPGDHGSTFGGNPLAAAVALEAIEIALEEKFAERSAELGAYLLAQLRRIASPLIREVRGKGLFIGIDIDPARASARKVCERLLARGILSKDTHGTVVRLAPPLVIERSQIDWALGEIRATLAEIDQEMSVTA